MELNKENFKKILVLVLAIVLIYLGIKNIYVILKAVSHFLRFIFPFVLGAIFAFILNVPLRFFEGKIRRFGEIHHWKLKKYRMISFFMTLLLVFGVVFIILFLVIPQLTSTGKVLWNNMPEYGENIKNWLSSLQIRFPMIKGLVESVEKIDIDWEQAGHWLMSLQNGQVGNMVSSTFDIISNVVSGVVNFLIALVFACYILFQKEHLSEQGKRLLYALMPEKYVVNTMNFCKLVDDTFSRFIIGQCTEAAILGSMFVVSMLILRMPYAILIGALVVVTALIPIVGSTLACVIGAFLMLTVSPMKALFFVILFLVLQQIEGHFVYPNVVGNSIGLPAIWVLLALTVGGKLFGIGGMLIGIPTMTVVYVLLGQWIESNLLKRGVNQDKWQNRNRSDADRRKDEKIRQRYQVVIKLPEKIPTRLKDMIEFDEITESDGEKEKNVKIRGWQNKKRTDQENEKKTEQINGKKTEQGNEKKTEQINKKKTEQGKEKK